MEVNTKKVSNQKLREAYNNILDIDKRALKLEKEFYPNIKNLLKKISKQFTAIFDIQNTYSTSQIKAFVDNYKSDLISLYRLGFDMANDEFGYDLRKKLLNKSQKQQIQKAIKYEVSDSDVLEMDKNYYKEWVLFENNQSEIETEYLIDSLTRELEKEVKDAQSGVLLYFSTFDNKINELLQKITEIQNNLVSYSDKYAILNKYKNELNELQETREKEKEKVEALTLAAFIKGIDKTFINHAKQLADTIINIAEAKARNLEYSTIKKQKGNVKKNDKVYTYEEILEEAFWVSMGDNRVRITHAVADGQLKVNNTYIVGGYSCSYPRDPSLPIGERIRCRCREHFALK